MVFDFLLWEDLLLSASVLLQERSTPSSRLAALRADGIVNGGGMTADQMGSVHVPSHKAFSGRAAADGRLLVIALSASPLPPAAFDGCHTNSAVYVNRDRGGEVNNTRE
jgi:hypothetical protein